MNSTALKHYKQPETIAPTKFAYLDIAKAIGILMVVFAHINTEGGYIYRTFYSFHIPLFFIIAGMTFKHEGVSFGKFIGKKAKRLLAPYLVYSLITFAWYALVEVNMPEFNLTANQSIAGSFLEIFLARGSVDYMQHNPALWFIPCLFLTETLFYLICKCKKEVKFVLAVLAGVCGYVFTQSFMPSVFRELPWQAEVALAAVPFMLFGEWISKRKGLGELEKSVTDNKVRSWIIVVLGAAIVVGLTKLNAWFLPADAKGHISMGSKYFGNFGLFYVNALTGTMVVIMLSALLANLFKERIELHKSKLVWLGERSYAIMAIHFPVKRRMVVIVAQAIDKWGLATVNGGFTKYTSGNLFASFVAFVFTMAITIIISIAAQAFIQSAKLPGSQNAKLHQMQIQQPDGDNQ